MIKNCLPYRAIFSIGSLTRPLSFGHVAVDSHISTNRTISSSTRILRQQASGKVSQADDKIGWTNKLEVLEPTYCGPVPKYRVLNEDGSLGGELDPSLSQEKLIQLHKDMLKLNVLDTIMFECQRQGRISFYMTSFGEEATQLGSSGALEPQDLVFAQYREAGVLINRNMSLYEMICQTFGNSHDLGKGRQMPIHYGNKALNYVTISSPLATQIPQAVGAAYAFKQQAGNNRLTICYFGEGAASEGDAHAGLNFASTLDCPVVFFCRNNGYAISTPTHEQFRGDGIVSRASGYGMAAIRVDGNDLLAVYAATREARRFALDEHRPVLIEAMTYRVGHHSTSDDSSAYRPATEVRLWQAAQLDPIKRLSRYLIGQGVWSEEQERVERDFWRKEVLDSLSRAEKVLKGPVLSMFDDVYAEPTSNLNRQREHLKAHLEVYGKHYNLPEYAGID